MRYSQLPSNISTMVFGRYKMKIIIINKIKSNKHIIRESRANNKRLIGLSDIRPNLVLKLSENLDDAKSEHFTKVSKYRGILFLDL